MPTYEYRCTACSHTFDLFQRMSDEPVAACPECGESSERLLSGGAGFLFKGDGFYITDYRSDSYKKKAASDGGAGAKSAGEGGSDAKKASDGGSSSDVKASKAAPEKAKD